MTEPWEFRWYNNHLPPISLIQPNHKHVLLKYCNISELYYAIQYETHCFQCPDWIEYFDISYNSIYDLYNGNSTNYLLPKHLQLWNIARNKLTLLPEILPIELQAIQAKGNQIERFPYNLPTSLVHLDFGYNCISNWNPSQIMSNLQTLRLNNNHLKYFDWNSLPKQLEYLDLQENQLYGKISLPDDLQYLNLQENFFTELPPLPETLQYLNIHKNRITEIQFFPKQLKTCLIGQNQLSILDESLINCINLQELDYQGNPNLKISSKLLDFIEQRFHEIRMLGLREQNIQLFQQGHLDLLDSIYQDTQNVHHLDTYLYETTQRFITEHPEWIRPTLDELIKEAEGWNVPQDVLLIIQEEWDMTSQISLISVSLGVIWCAFWARLRQWENERTAILDILIHEVRDSNNVCFTGRVGRILGILQGFDPSIELKIPLNEQIVARYTQCQKRLQKQQIPEDSLTYLRELECDFVSELENLDVSLDTILVWITPIQTNIRETINQIPNWVEFRNSWIYPEHKKRQFEIQYKL